MAATLKPVDVFRFKELCARVAELADAPDSKSGSREGVRVRPPPRAPFTRVSHKIQT